MAVIRRATLVASFVICAICFGQAAKTFPPQTGERRDDHGHIKWESSVQQSPDQFHFFHAVWNRSTERNCRINWEQFKLVTTILPSNASEHKSSLIDAPRGIPIAGVLKYNGGPAAGDAKTDTKAWLPEDGKSQEVVNSVTVAVDVGGSIYPLVIKSRSSVEKSKVAGYAVLYELALEPDRSIKGTGVSYDVRKLLTMVTVQWQSIASTKWISMEPIEFAYGRITDGKFVHFDKTDEVKSTFTFKVSLNVAEPALMRQDVLEFRPNYETNTPPVAQTVLSAYGLK